jgi:predicted nucleic acid-binding Zn ribbon protein
MIEGQVYRCESCGCEIKVIRASIRAEANPRCSCGTGMKKPYRKPGVQKLSSDTEVVAMAKANRS